MQSTSLHIVMIRAEAEEVSCDIFLLFVPLGESDFYALLFTTLFQEVVVEVEGEEEVVVEEVRAYVAYFVHIFHLYIFC